MISVGSINEIKIDNFDEIWLCVNSVSSIPDLQNISKVKWIPQLAPDDKLFSWYKEQKKKNKWNASRFQQYYVPWFLKLVSESSEARRLLNYLVEESSRKDIYVCCFCTNEDEETCHRSILWGVLFNKKANIEKCPLHYQKYKLVD